MTTDDYIAAIEDPIRREMVSQIRDVVRANLDPRFEEGIQYRCIGWYVPHSIYPAGYHCDPKEPVPFVGLANSKSHVGFHAFCMYVDEAITTWFAEEHRARTGRLDMGKSCVRYKKPEHVSLELIGELIKKISLDDFLAHYMASIPDSKRK